MYVSAIKVLVADDHPVFRDGLKSVLATDPDMRVVAEAGEGREAIAAFKEHVNSLLAKLEAKDRTDAAMIALKRGLIR